MGGSLRRPVAAPPRGLSQRIDPSCTSQCMVIQDIASGWDGLCVGLQLQNASTTAAACREACCSDPKCEVWQWGNTREMASESSLGICKTGRGLECSSDHFENFLVLAGQRVSHGAPSDTAKLEPGEWCTGVGMRQAALRPKQALQDDLAQCRDVCYDDAGCSVWQYSAAEGCWYGAADRCSRHLAGGMMDGERVARACGFGDLPAEHTSYIRVFGVIGVVGFLLTVVATILLVLWPLRRRRDRLLSDDCSLGRREFFFGLRDAHSEEDCWDEEADVHVSRKAER